MADFAALMREPKEDRDARVAAAQAEYEQHLARTLQERRAMVAELCAPEVLDSMSDRDRSFVLDMQRKGEARDTVTGVDGGGLTLISDAQLAYLKSLHRNVAHRPDPQSRAARYRSAGG